MSLLLLLFVRRFLRLVIILTMYGLYLVCVFVFFSSFILFLLDWLEKLWLLVVGISDVRGGSRLLES